MNIPNVRCFFSLENGKVVRARPGAPELDEYEKDRESYRPVGIVTSAIQYGWLDAFVQSVEDNELRVRMEAAINGKGAFRRFKDILSTIPDERKRWFEYRDEKIRKYIVDWITEIGVSAVNEPDWTRDETVQTPLNSPRDLQALRDFVVARKEKGANLATHEDIEALCRDICEEFKVRPK